LSAAAHSTHKKKRPSREEEEPDEETEPDLETLSAVIKLEVESFYLVAVVV
jgi:hypothetical protein